MASTEGPGFLTIIGSGPVAMSCLWPLVQRGHKVRILDAGVQLEKESQVALDRAKQSTTISPDFARKIRSAVQATSKGVEFKLTYGSDFPYRGAELQIHPASAGIGQLTTSLALGGYSNVWGSAILPYPVSEIAAWPISYSELLRAYNAVSERLRVSPTGDALEQLYPRLQGPTFALPRSKQAQALCSRLLKNADWLQREGLRFGPAQLAFRPTLAGNFSVQDECVSCGLCMYGCPYELIYSSKHTLKELQHKFPGQIEYCSGVLVDSLEELNSCVVIHARGLADDQVYQFPAERVLLAAGAIASTGILLRSFKEYTASLEMKVSEYFMLPMLGPKYRGALDTPQQHTLAQVFGALFDPRISEHLIHLQVYTYNDLYKKGLEALLGPLALGAGPLLRRLHVLQGYLHSDDSSLINVGLQSYQDPRVVMNGKSNPSAKHKIQRIARKLLRISLRTGLTPLVPMLSVGKPGDGRHVGGTFPMTHLDNQDFSTDTLGRPRGRGARLTRVHVMDTTNFPTIPAPTITFTAMANAHRIAESVALDYQKLALKAEGA